MALRLQGPEPPCGGPGEDDALARVQREARAAVALAESALRRVIEGEFSGSYAHFVEMAGAGNLGHFTIVLPTAAALATAAGENA